MIANKLSGWVLVHGKRQIMLINEFYGRSQAFSILDARAQGLPDSTIDRKISLERSRYEELLANFRGPAVQSSGIGTTQWLELEQLQLRDGSQGIRRVITDDYLLCSFRNWH